ncbi:restriction endonuclease subunit S [Maricaulis salignorans]|uniref:restriction endonuclease subunit S n=1 Tax=Maricaulis salignorans TaxID=144026 RepID=UPI003A93934A
MENIAFVRRDFHDSIYPRCNAEFGDVLLTKDGSNTGQATVNTFREPISLLSSVCLLKPDPTKLNGRFLIYYIQSNAGFENLTGQMTGAAIKRIVLNRIKTSEIPLPPLEEQQRIVAILDEAFEGLARAKANAEANLASAKELFDRAVSLEFEGLMERYPAHPLAQLTSKITKGSSPKWQGVSYVDEPGVLFITSENVGKNQLDLTRTKYVEEAFNQKDQKSILSAGDVLTNIVGASIGRTAIYDLPHLANINQAVCLIRCEPGRLHNAYLAYLLNSPFFKSVLHSAEVNMARANLSLSFFRQLKVPAPPIERQKSTAKLIERLQGAVGQAERRYSTRLEDLGDLRQSLLAKAFTGDLT